MIRSFFNHHSPAKTEEFRARVLKLVRAMYPDVTVESPEEEGDVLRVGDLKIGIQNLKARFEQTDRSEQVLEKLVAEHFAFLLNVPEVEQDFATAKARLRPQIMPPEYAEQAPILSFPFGQTLAIGIVLDREEGYVYVRHEDAVRWKKSERELLDLAIENLDAASREMQMHASEGEDVKFVAIETKDGFDAARILIPGLRDFLAARLGIPFCFGIPNRDFIICWNSDASAGFSDFVADKLQNDFDTQPYPLSPQVFEVDSVGRFSECD